MARLERLAHALARLCPLAGALTVALHASPAWCDPLSNGESPATAAAPHSGALPSPLADLPVEQEPKRPMKTVWYGWQTLLADAASVGLIAAGSAVDNDEYDAGDHHDGDALIAIGAGGYFLGGPAVHALQGSPEKAIGSLGMRAVGPALAMVWVSQCFTLNFGDHEDSTPAGCGALGALALLAVPTAMLVDAIVLGRKEVPTNHYAVHVAPWVSADRKGTGITGAVAF